MEPGQDAALERHERVHGGDPRDAAGVVARSPGSSRAACAASAGVRGGRERPRRQAPRLAGSGVHARGSRVEGTNHVRSVAREPGHRGLRMQRVAVVVFPGSNCDADTLDAAHAAGSDAYFVWHRDTDLKQADAVILPGGFSYGDYLRAGAIARFSPVLRAVTAHARAGGAVLGICNGFQILCEAGLLSGALMRNAGLKFLSRPVRVRLEATDTPFTVQYERGEELTLPIAHGDGRYVADPETAATLEANGQVVLRYVTENPNGSTHDIAGVCNAGRNVVGIMPHPERRNAEVLGGQDGARIFLSLEARNATQHAGDMRAVDGRHLRV